MRNPPVWQVDLADYDTYIYVIGYPFVHESGKLYFRNTEHPDDVNAELVAGFSQSWRIFGRVTGIEAKDIDYGDLPEPGKVA